MTNPLNSFSSCLIAKFSLCSLMVLTFGGLIAANRIIERIDLFAIKRLLNAGPRMPSSLVYGETGRYPLYISAYTRCIKYWLNILRMQEDQIRLKSYQKCFIICTVTTKTTGPPLFAAADVSMLNVLRCQLTY